MREVLSVRERERERERRGEREINTKLLEIEKEIVREVALGE